MAPAPAVIPAGWVDAAGALYLSAVRRASSSRGGLDPVVSTFLKENRSLGDNGRAFVVDAAQGMLRVRSRLDAAARMLSFEPTRAALVALYLIGARGHDPRDLPFDPRGAVDLADAWRKTDALPLSTRASIPEWLAAELLRTRSDGEQLALSFSTAPPMTLRANRLMASPDDVVGALARDGFAAHRGSLSPDAVIMEHRDNVFRSKAFHDGLFEVQDEGSQLVSLVCEAKAGMTVVDGCAGAGGKTLHLAAQMEGKGTLYALDTSTRRLDALRERSRRAGAHNIRVHALEDRKILKRLEGAADVVLVDAPCSGTGVLRRNPDTAWRLSIDDVERMRGQQEEILESYARLVKPGGRLVYATCSLLARENREVVDAIASRHVAFEHVRVDEILARQSVQVPDIGEDLAIDSLRHGTDGFYASALLNKS